MKRKLEDIYYRLLERFSYQSWWPADSKDEMVIGALLTQNTSWNNVEIAITNMKRENLCSLEKIFKADCEVLKKCIKPAGFFNQKASYLKNIAEFFVKNGSFNKLDMFDNATLRKKLLSVKGVGKETADSILLYAFNRAVFVVDAYTRRLVERHNLLKEISYDNIQHLFESNLKKDSSLFGEYHALIVKNAKVFCKTKPLCYNCPILGI